MKSRLCIAVLAATVLMAAGGCSDPRVAQLAAQRASLSAQLADAEAMSSTAHQQLYAQSRKVRELERDLATQQAELDDLNSSVRVYMLDHKAAVAAIVAGLGGGAVALDESGQYTQQARQLSGLAGVVAVGWALFNMPEVIQVGSDLANAERRAAVLRQRMGALQASLNDERTALQQARAGEQAANDNAANIRASLANL